jgi:hypothetical protein
MELKLEIRWNNETGQVNVEGPIDNKGVCYLMLENARDAIKDHCDRVTRQNQEAGLITKIDPLAHINNGRLVKNNRTRRG